MRQPKKFLTLKSGLIDIEIINEKILETKEEVVVEGKPIRIDLKKGGP